MSDVLHGYLYKLTQLQYNVGYMASELAVARQIDYTVAWTLDKYYLLTYLKTTLSHSVVRQWNLLIIQQRVCMTPSQRAAWTNTDNTAAHSQKLFTWSVNNFTSPTHYTTYSDTATIARTTITFTSYWKHAHLTSSQQLSMWKETRAQQYLRWATVWPQ